MPALVRLRELPGRARRLAAQRQPARCTRPSRGACSPAGRRAWPFPELRLLGHRWAEPDMEDVFTAYSQGYHAVLQPPAVATGLAPMSFRLSLRRSRASRTRSSCTSCATGASSSCSCCCRRSSRSSSGTPLRWTERTDTPALLLDARWQRRRASASSTAARRNKTFRWRASKPAQRRREARFPAASTCVAALVIPHGVGRGPRRRRAPAAPALPRWRRHEYRRRAGGPRAGRPRRNSSSSRARADDRRPARGSVSRWARSCPVEVRKQFDSAMTPWELTKKILYNPKERFIDYVLPGIIGLILQLLTVTLTACTIARERESGTLYQLSVTSLRHSEIVIGKMLPYLAISIVLILVIVVVGGWHFQVAFHQPPGAGARLPALPALLARSRAAHLRLLPHADAGHPALRLFPPAGLRALRRLCAAGAAAGGVRVLSECFPLTHFCRAFRLLNLYQAPIVVRDFRSAHAAPRGVVDFRRRGAAAAAGAGVRKPAQVPYNLAPTRALRPHRLRGAPASPQALAGAPAG